MARRGGVGHASCRQPHPCLPPATNHVGRPVVVPSASTKAVSVSFEPALDPRDPVTGSVTAVTDPDLAVGPLAMLLRHGRDLLAETYEEAEVLPCSAAARPYHLALLAERGVQGPPGVIEARDGFMQAFALGRSEPARPIQLPPAVPFGITDCYIKPYPCCRHIQPAVEALIDLLAAEAIATEDVERIDVATYRIAAEHAHTGWDDFASAQLSFPYLVALALRCRSIRHYPNTPFPARSAPQQPVW